MKIKYYFRLLSALILLAGCECVPGIDTPKIVEPQNYSKINIINALTDSDKISFLSNDAIIFDTLGYSNSTADYKKILSGTSGFQVLTLPDSTIVFNSSFYLENEKSYSMIVFGKKTKTRIILLDDMLPAKDTSKFYIRFANCTQTFSEVKFQLNNAAFEQQVSYKFYTNNFALSPVTSSVKILDTSNNVLAEIPVYNFLANRLYTIVFRNIKTSGGQKNDCFISVNKL
ncbi:MAG: DUF4397 domain-containing protein [Bacteroidota bacterium]